MGKKTIPREMCLAGIPFPSIKYSGRSSGKEYAEEYR
jgi:hypothetical protein